MSKNNINMRSWTLSVYEGEYILKGTAEYAPYIGRNAGVEVRFRMSTDTISDDILICETEENRYVCPLKYMCINPYEGMDKKYAKKLSKLSKKSDSMVDAVISASAQQTIGRWKGQLAKRILKLQEEGQKELDAMDKLHRNHLMEEAMKYENSLYIEWQNIGNDNLMAYHIGDKVGIIEPKLSVGTYSDSVHYTKYRGEQDELYIDFRYHDSMFRCYETYMWSDNTTQAVIKNITEWDISINNNKIKPGETFTLPWDGSQVRIYQYDVSECEDFDEALDEISRKYGLD